VTATVTPAAAEAPLGPLNDAPACAVDGGMLRALPGDIGVIGPKAPKRGPFEAEMMDNRRLCRLAPPNRVPGLEGTPANSAAAEPGRGACTAPTPSATYSSVYTTLLRGESEFKDHSSDSRL